MKNSDSKEKETTQVNEVNNYYVLLMFKHSLPSVVFSTTFKEDALSYATIMKRAKPEDEFKVVTEIS